LYLYSKEHLAVAHIDGPLRRKADIQLRHHILGARAARSVVQNILGARAASPLLYFKNP
jgi:hypothetical protein